LKYEKADTFIDGESLNDVGFTLGGCYKQGSFWQCEYVSLKLGKRGTTSSNVGELCQY
jgi:hypothetical protein